MKIEEYYTKIEELGDIINNLGIATQDYLHEAIINKNKEILSLINFRKTFVDAKEQKQVIHLLASGLFSNLSEIERIACFMIVFEIDDIKIKKSWRKRCEKYTQEQPIFKLEPELYTKIRQKKTGAIDNELIDYSSFKQVNDSAILNFNNSYTLIDSSLNSYIAKWTHETFPNSAFYIRVNPYKAFSEQPPQMLLEAAQIPANPNWWKKLTIYKRTKEVAAYELTDCSPKENQRQYWELHIKNINRLEIIAKRNNSGNLSMMIEEITSIDSRGLLFGRMIHLDSDSPYGTDFNDATLNHLDLAINIYESEDAKLRLEQNLASGNKTISATYRTHLLRIENIPFKSLFGYASLFFISQTLVHEWIADQFKE